MKSISSFGNNQDPFSDKENGSKNPKSGYTPSYLAKQEKADEIAFTGNKTKPKGIFKRALLGAMAALTALTGSGCANTVAKAPETNNVSQVDYVEGLDGIGTDEALDLLGLDSASNKVQLLDINNTVPVATIFSTVKDEDEENSVIKMPNILCMTNDEAPEGYQHDSITKVVPNPTNEANETNTLFEAINKQ
ncbi:MAG: hypothetical protein Q4F80_00480, partial [bacterium]|nr:hypothetical protein [bacterium]